METKTGAGTIFLRVVFTGLLIYSVIFIFQNSLQIAQVSTGQSQRVLELINTLMNRLGLETLKMHTVRKMAHLAEFMAMGFWFMMCLRVYTKHYIRHISWPLFAGLFTAVTDETIQLFVEGRSSSTIDVFIDFAGVLCGLFAALMIFIFVKICRIIFVG